jgi:hypothetical protein
VFLFNFKVLSMLPEKIVKVSLPYLIAGIIMLMSVSFAAGSYKNAFENEKQRGDTMQVKIDGLTKALDEKATGKT